MLDLDLPGLPQAASEGARQRARHAGDVDSAGGDQPDHPDAVVIIYLNSIVE